MILTGKERFIGPTVTNTKANLRTTKSMGLEPFLMLQRVHGVRNTGLKASEKGETATKVIKKLNENFF